MAINSFDVLREASRIATSPPSLEEVFLTVVLIILLGVIFIVLPWYLYNTYKEHVRYKAFSRVAQTFNLEKEEIDFLWNLAKELNITPILLLTSYKTFQKMIFKYARLHKDIDNSIVYSIKKKLGFDKIPSFVPLTTTMEIDIHQPVTVIVGESRYDGVVVDNNILYWSVAFLNREPTEIKPDSEVIVTFTRPSDGKYIITTKVLDVVRQDGKLIIRLEHTDKLEKIQLRNFIRWPVEIPCKFAILPDDYLSIFDLEELLNKLKFYDGVIKDISGGGLKVCSSIYPELEKMQEGSYILVDFFLDKTHFENILCEIRRIDKILAEKTICLGCLFTDLPKDLQQKIFQFIWNEQRKIIKQYKEKRFSSVEV